MSREVLIMEWIKTTDRLPPTDDGKWILFVFEDEIKMGSYEEFRDHPYWVDFHNVRHHPDRVDYWMPLPEPPITLPEAVNHIPNVRKMIDASSTTISSEPTKWS